MSAKKIISLLPSATEIVCALGLEDQLAGRSHECDYPEFVKQLPVCSYPRFDTDLSSTDIDRTVKELTMSAISLYRIDEEQIRNIQPDVIITQDQCKVCAVNIDDVQQVLKDVTGNDTEVISLHPSSPDDILKDILQVASRLGVSARAEVLVESLNERIDIIKHKLRFVEDRPSVACIEWLSPLMISGNWMPEIIEVAGGKPVLAQKGGHSSYVEFEALKDVDPDILIIAVCGFTIERTIKEIGVLLEYDGWNDLSAVKNNQVYIADGNRYFNRPGPGIIDTAEMLAEIIQPKQFIFGFEGSAWVKFGI
ncbi:iron complex transport system substrate-binding protein [Arcticibacter tournemirensis]|uniref:Cobalamin-binding protein n=1 Tax=Arcticibacter tournemirensis TaxID=699437 RepID=A0A5M9H5Z5_9SPHI|nr:cobalamin-binding protein [Arcticibacter tournemirensis]KAA8482070.1 cobalamin-binding protein [Arcticibacter tournemirensis]TQM49482.1 iron complex transport system substrate-binding protein [Arcticibacter tournemirensis]